MLAVYSLLPRYGLSVGDHITVPLVKLPEPDDDPLGAAPATGSTTPVMAALVMGVLPVGGNTAVITPELAGLVTVVAPATVKELAATPCTVKPVLGVKVIVAV